jgi:hypothetical protein
MDNLLGWCERGLECFDLFRVFSRVHATQVTRAPQVTFTHIW